MNVSTLLDQAARKSIFRGAGRDDVVVWCGADDWCVGINTSEGRVTLFKDIRSMSEACGYRVALQAEIDLQLEADAWSDAVEAYQEAQFEASL